MVHGWLFVALLASAFINSCTGQTCTQLQEIAEKLVGMYKVQENLLKAIQQVSLAKFTTLEQLVKNEVNKLNTKVSGLANVVNQIKSKVEKINTCKPACPKGFHDNTVGCYQFVTTKKTYDNAKAYCKARSSHLVTIESKTEQLALLALMKAKKAPSAWYRIGAKKINNVWKWEATGATLSYTDWQSGEPSTKTDDLCIEFKGPGSWDAYSCTIERYFICEI